VIKFNQSSGSLQRKLNTFVRNGKWSFLALTVDVAVASVADAAPMINGKTTSSVAVFALNQKCVSHAFPY